MWQRAEQLRLNVNFPSSQLRPLDFISRAVFRFTFQEVLIDADNEVAEEGELREGWLPDGYSQIFRWYVFGPSGFWTMAPLRYAAKFDPFLSLDCAPTPSTLAQSKERKGSNFAIWQP